MLIITENFLFGEVLESLLSHISSFRIHQQVQVNVDALLEEIIQHQPEVILLEDGLVDSRSQCLLSQLFENGRIRVILVNPQKNQVHIHDKFSVSLTQSADLLTLIENFSAQTTEDHLKRPIPTA